MPKFRYINTAIWDDDWFTSLDALEQHLFIYFLTNAYSNIAGIYQIPLRKIAFETGMDQEKVKKILSRFDADGKVFYEQGYLIMKNWQAHQVLNPNQATAVCNLINALPEWLRLLIFDVNSPQYIAFESLSKGSLTVRNGSLSLWYNSKGNSKSNSKSNPKGNTEPFGRLEDNAARPNEMRRAPSGEPDKGEGGGFVDLMHLGKEKKS